MDLITLLMTHALCNEVAATRTMPPAEAAACSENFERVKIALNPDLTWADFQALERPERSAVSVASYSYYLKWKNDNPVRYRDLEQQAKAQAQAGM